MPRAAKKEAEPVLGNLGTFEGREIVGIKIAIMKAGDGLSKAMAVEPKILHQGDEGYLVLAYRTTKIRFDPLKDDDDAAERIQILEANGATFVDADLVGDVVTKMRERVEEYEEEQKEAKRRAKEEARGVFTFQAAAEDDDDQA
jgi:hypothetical protein